MKVLITGAHGMLGSAICEDLKAASSQLSLKFVKTTKKELDITDKKSVLENIQLHKPDVIINCAAYTNVEKSESDREACFALNVTGVSHLAQACKQFSIFLIHFSTDYVFDGKKKEGYVETDTPCPINYYGKTKQKGEQQIITQLDTYLIVRISWLFGKNGNNFVEKMISLSSKKDELPVVNDQYGKPTFTRDVAKKIVSFLPSLDKYQGIYHLPNEGVCSWFDFAKSIFSLANLSHIKVLPCDSQTYPSALKRPKYSVLRNTKTQKLKSWKKALKEYMEEVGYL